MSEHSRRNSTREKSPSDLTVIVDSIRAIVKALRDSGRDTEQRLGITSAQLYVLQELRDKPASINELAARTYTHQSSVSMVVARLVENRLVTRSAARNDGRRVLISLTASGKALMRKAPDAAQTRIVSALRSMSKSDLNSLSTGLESLTGVMAEQQKGASKKTRLSITA